MTICPLCETELVNEKCPNSHALYWRQGQPDAQMTRILNTPFDELPQGVKEVLLGQGPYKEDADAIKSDWRAVGDELRWAMDVIDNLEEHE